MRPLHELGESFWSKESVLRHVTRVVRIAPLVLPVTIVLFAVSIPRIPRSPGFWLSSAAVGCVWFVLVWQYWRSPNHRFFGLLICLFVFPSFVLPRSFLGRGQDLSLWVAVQYFSVTCFVVLTLLLLLQRRVLTSLSSDAGND